MKQLKLFNTKFWDLYLYEGVDDDFFGEMFNGKKITTFQCSNFAKWQEFKERKKIRELYEEKEQ